jgi:glyoxylase-like metal-dependent hydrolase (beta-lactamase superfamily II)
MAGDRIAIGSVEIISLVDVEIDHPLGLDHVFPEVPTAAWEPYLRRYPGAFGGPNVWRVQMGGYLLQSRGRTILVDTGLGPAGALVGSGTPNPVLVQPPAHLLENLRAVGVHPEEVEMVVLTHLHADHVGWNLLGEDDQRQPTFPRARYLIHQVDWETFTQGAGRFPWVEQTIAPLQTLGLLELTSDGRALTDQLTLLHTPGHTPGHQSVLVASEDERAIVWGDLAVHPAQLTEPDWRFAADMDTDAARETRRHMLDRIEAEGMTVAARHFPVPGFGRLVRIEGRRYWQGV